jgi:hypothetical protein
MFAESLGGRGCSANSSSFLKAGTALRCLPNRAQSVLVRASDGNTYGVKMLGNTRGPNVLANEALGAELARHLGLTVPRWRSIEMSDEFLDRNNLCWFKTSSEHFRPIAGLHFASPIIGQDASTAVYEVLPGEWISRVDNREDFVGMLLLDIWANHTDNRQSVFTRDLATQKLTAIFVDNGHMFGGPSGQEVYRRGSAMYLDRRVYEGLDMKGALNRWLERVRSIDKCVLLRLAESVPNAWMSERYLEKVISQLQIRKGALEQLFHHETNLIKGVRKDYSPTKDARKASKDRSAKPVLRMGRLATNLRRGEMDLAGSGAQSSDGHDCFVTNQG